MNTHSTRKRRADGWVTVDDDLKTYVEATEPCLMWELTRSPWMSALEIDNKHLVCVRACVHVCADAQVFRLLCWTMEFNLSMNWYISVYTEAISIIFVRLLVYCDCDYVAVIAACKFDILIVFSLFFSLHFFSIYLWLFWTFKRRIHTTLARHCKLCMKWNVVVVVDVVIIIGKTICHA